MSIFLQIPIDDNKSSSSSRSNSFSVYDEIHVRKPRRAISLEEINLYSSKREIQRAKRRRSTQISSRRASKRYSSRKLQRNERNLNSIYNRSISRQFSNSGSIKHSRTSSRSSRQLQTSESPRQTSRHTSNTSYLDKLYAEEILRKDRKRRKVVAIVIVSFCLLLLTSIWSVVITLTHQSTAVIEKGNITVNKTYYTFASAPEVICKPGTYLW